MISKISQNVITAYKKGYRIILGEINYKNKKIKGKIGNNGYRLIGLRDELGNRINAPVHRLVAYQKYGDKIFEKGIYVRHYDGDKLNNLLENILIGTHSENMMDKHPDVRRNAAIKASLSAKKHNHDDIIKYHKEGNSYKKIKEKFGIKSNGTISFIINKSIHSNEL